MNVLSLFSGVGMCRSGEQMNPTLGSLFDGIAGFPYAASLEGITPVWASEIEPFPMSVSARHFPNMKQLGDVTKINGAEIEPVDIITFGSPCQDLSVAGKRAGFDGARSGLFMEAVRIIEEMRTATNGLYPRYAIWENVPGAFSSNGGRDFRAAVGALVGAEVPMPLSGGWATAGMVRGNGRSVAWRVFDAQYWGVPQRRRRIFLIADFRGQRAPEILFEREGVSGDTEAGRSEGEGVAGGIEGGAGGVLSFNLRGREGGAMPEVDPDSLANIRAAGGGSSRTYIAYGIDLQGGKGGANYTENVAPTIMHDSHGTPHAVCITGDKTHCLKAEGFDGACNNPNSNPNGSNSPAIAHNYRVRRLTPLECERLQGLPDGWTAGGSDTARYKAIGNSIAIPPVRWILKQIREAPDA